MKRAIGIVRVSEVGKRAGDRAYSPDIQEQLIRRDCERMGLRVIDVRLEMDVSGGWPLHRRVSLTTALRDVENGNAEAIVFAYRDHVDRSIEHGSELVRRMEAAGGLLIADGKQITHTTHDGCRHATQERFLSEDQRRAVGAKMLDVHKRSVERGVPPQKLPPGYRRCKDGTAEPDPKTDLAIRSAWQMRADGATIENVRRWLRESGVDLSYSRINLMFGNRFYLGELHYRTDVIEPNLSSHEPLVSQELYDAVQRVRGSLRGRQAKSPHLFSRIGVLLCGSCGSRMVASGRGTKRPGAFYRCGGQDCVSRANIDAKLVEGLVWDRILELADGIIGEHPGEETTARLKAAWDEAEHAYQKIVARVLELELEGELEAVKRLRELKGERDTAKAEYDASVASDEAAHAIVTAKTVVGHGTLDEQRDLVRAVIESVTVGRGKGTDRVKIKARIRPQN